MELQNGKIIIVDAENLMSVYPSASVEKLKLSDEQKQEVVRHKVTDLLNDYDCENSIRELVTDDPETIDMGLSYFGALADLETHSFGTTSTGQDQKGSYEAQMQTLLEWGAKLYAQYVFAGKIAMYGALDMTKDEFEEIEQDVDAGIGAFAKFVEFAVAEKVALYMHPDFDVDNGMVEDEQGVYSSNDIEAFRQDRMTQKVLRLRKAGFTLEEVQDYLSLYGLTDLDYKSRPMKSLDEDSSRSDELVHRRLI